MRQTRISLHGEGNQSYFSHPKDKAAGALSVSPFHTLIHNHGLQVCPQGLREGVHRPRRALRLPSRPASVPRRSKRYDLQGPCGRFSNFPGLSRSLYSGLILLRTRSRLPPAHRRTNHYPTTQAGNAASPAFSPSMNSSPSPHAPRANTPPSTIPLSLPRNRSSKRLL